MKFYIVMVVYKEMPLELAEWHVFTDKSDGDIFVENMKECSDLVECYEAVGEKIETPRSSTG